MEASQGYIEFKVCLNYGMRPGLKEQKSMHFGREVVRGGRCRREG